MYTLSKKIRSGLLMEQVIAALPQGRELGGWQVADCAKAAGFRVLGNGAFGAAVMGADPDIVIKVCARVESDSYPVFAEWAADNSHPNLVQIYHTYWNEDRTLFMAALERLNPSPAIYADDEFGDYLPALQYYSECGVSDRGVPLRFRELRDLMRHVVLEFAEWGQLDMHGGNFLCREDGTVVLTDPIGELYMDNRPIPAHPPIQREFIFDHAELEQGFVVNKADREYLDEVAQQLPPLPEGSRVRLRAVMNPELRVDMSAALFLANMHAEWNQIIQGNK